jgi:hypothetical protein
MKTTTKTQMEKRLRYVLSLVNGWLEFAEKKNAALLAADSAAVFGVLACLDRATSLHVGILLCLYLGLALLGLAATCCLISFIPQFQIPWLAARRKTSRDDNLVFYADIANYDPASFLQALYEHSGIEEIKDDALMSDYAEQIITNSRIAERKYRCFNTAIWLTVAAVLTPLGAIVICLLRKRR